MTPQTPEQLCSPMSKECIYFLPDVLAQERNFGNSSGYNPYQTFTSKTPLDKNKLRNQNCFKEDEIDLNTRTTHL